MKFAIGLAVRFGLLYLAVIGHAWAGNVLAFVTIGISVVFIPMAVIGMLGAEEKMVEVFEKTKPVSLNRVRKWFRHAANWTLSVAFIALGWWATAVASLAMHAMVTGIAAVHREVWKKAQEKTA